MNDAITKLRQRHLKFGWYSLLAFLVLGSVLELLHGFKVGFYLNVDHETRRLMWRLAHAHGALLAILNILFALCLDHLKQSAADLRFVSACLVVASLLLPIGFFGGGSFAHSGDPGLLILLVPVGALLLFVAVLSIARRA
jgi:hypothetical protein